MRRFLTPLESCLGNGFGLEPSADTCLVRGAPETLFHTGSLTVVASDAAFLSGSLDVGVSRAEVLRLYDTPDAKVSDKGRRESAKKKETERCKSINDHMSITKTTSNAISQSELEAKPCNRCKSREKLGTVAGAGKHISQGLTGFGFVPNQSQPTEVT